MRKALLLFAFALFVGCTVANEKNLCGTYFVQYSFGTERLTLMPSGEYKQEVTIADPQAHLVHKGRWNYDPIGKYVILDCGLSVETFTGELEPDFAKPFEGYVLCKVVNFPPWSRLRLATAKEGEYMDRVK